MNWCTARWVQKGEFNPALQHRLLVEQLQMNAEASPPAFDAEHLLHALMPSKHNSDITDRLAKWFASIYCPYILLFFSEELITGEIKLFKSCHHSPTNLLSSILEELNSKLIPIYTCFNNLNIQYQFNYCQQLKPEEIKIGFSSHLE